jgi:hypothetical protein
VLHVIIVLLPLSFSVKTFMTDVFHSVPSPLQGKVSIAVKSGVKLEIPDGVVLQNKVRYYTYMIYHN